MPQVRCFFLYKKKINSRYLVSCGEWKKNSHCTDLKEIWIRVRVILAAKRPGFGSHLGQIRLMSGLQFQYNMYVFINI